MIPEWLHILSIFSLMAGLICAGMVAADEKNDPQHMWIMNVVWPIVSLFAPVIAMVFYFKYGKMTARSHPKNMMKTNPGMKKGEAMSSMADTPYWVKVAKAASHCGSGCTVGDIIAEWLIFFVPTIAVWFGYKSIFADQIFAVWIADFILAFAIGVVFQYFTIKPMRDITVARGTYEAVKADALSLTSWQVGMYGFMAFAHFVIFGRILGVPLEVNSAEFWFMMQIAMLCGFATAYPVNWWLVKVGIKEAM